MRIGLIYGGPSEERGISINSARSVMDHLTPLGWEVIPLYCDRELNFFRLEPSHLYSNTPSDFDFKLNSKDQLTKSEFISTCLEMDIVFPVIHGTFGEDGKLQKLLEKAKIPFVGSSSLACSRMFDKEIANKYMTKRHFATHPNCCIDINDTPAIQKQKVLDFFTLQNIKKAVVKPTAGGSSIGVTIAMSPEDAVEKAQNIFHQKLGTRVMIESFCDGQEFTVMLLQNQRGDPVALIPTEIEIISGDLFSFRHKYLLTQDVKYHCPPRFNDEVIDLIRKTAQELFTFFDMRDFSRLDGWLLDDEKIIFSDFNPISGMEQNSFLFIQGSRIGFSHGDMLLAIIMQATRRYGIDCTTKPVTKNPESKRIKIIFGGETAERQISLLSGTNVWLKLLHKPDYYPSPYILGANHEIWKLPYSFTLNHTVEEILANCCNAEEIINKLKRLVPPVRQSLGLIPLSENEFILPCRMNIDQFCQESVDENAFIFIALHGGEGEDGRFQEKLNQYGLAYNGSDVKASQLCMNKFETGEVIRALYDTNLISAPKVCIPSKTTLKPEQIWDTVVKNLGTTKIIVKPQSDGCSAGVVPLNSEKDLEVYLQAIEKGQSKMAVGTKTEHHITVGLPICIDNFIFEPFIVTDEIFLRGQKLIHEPHNGWIELTVGVLEENANYRSFSPSITVVQGNVLSEEEKFQGGTGVNLTPPPLSIITSKQVESIKNKIEKAAKTLGIQGYARIDIFFNWKCNKVMVIEANSLPGLTPSTVIYHQALAEVPPLDPYKFLSKLIDSGTKRLIRNNQIPTE